MLPEQTGPRLLEVFLPEDAVVGTDRLLQRKAALAATLIAGLELARNGSLTLDQDAMWQPIHVEQGAATQIPGNTDLPDNQQTPEGDAALCH